MSEVLFNPSNSPTVGVEVEAQIVDNTTGNLVNIAEKSQNLGLKVKIRKLGIINLRKEVNKSGVD